VLEVVAWPKDRAGRRQALHRAEVADGVVVSSRLLSVSDTGRVRRRTPRLAFDFDDALPFRDSARGATPSATRRRRFRALVKAADLVIAGNAYLAGLAGSATVIPTVVEVDGGPPAPEPAAEPPVLGWIGSRATIPYLEGLGDVLAALVASGRPVRLRAVADQRPAMAPGIAVEAVRWTLEGWADAIAGTHVGLAPLPDDAWTRGKCGLKILQTMGVGRPVVADPVGVQADMVQDGETGFLARGPEAWLAALLNLLEDDAGRRRMGQQAKQVVRERWSRAAWAPRLVEAVKGWIG
jgi:hypothetical protein